MTVKKIMHKPIFVKPGTTVAEAARIMEEKNVSSVIVGTAEKPMGVFTERDVTRKCVAKKLSYSEPVASFMTPNVATVSADTSMEDAIEIMVTRYIRHMPVTDRKGRIVGMLSVRTLMDGLRQIYFWGSEQDQKFK